MAEQTFLDIRDILRSGHAGFVEVENEMERTSRITQDQIVQAVPSQAAKKRFDLSFPNSEQQYMVDYTRNGQNLLFAGSRGHVAALEWESGKLQCELQLEETVRDACWLSNEKMFAVSQRHFVYIYDGSGAEVHRLKKFTEVDMLQYLPYHFLLAGIGGSGVLRYQDITMGAIVGEVSTKMGRCRAMRMNPANAVMALGFAGGHLALHAPNVGGPLVTMQCHLSSINAIAFDSAGRHMVTAGNEGSIRIWDMRSYKKQLHEYSPHRPAVTLDVSQRGVLAAGFGGHVYTWTDALEQRAKTPYLQHLVAGETIRSVRFCPFDDVLGVGHSAGFSSLLIPGAGEPHYDTLEANPMASRQQKRESEVKKLLDKLPSHTIMLDTSCIGGVARTAEERTAVKNEMTFAANHAEGEEPDEALRKSKRAARKATKAQRRSNVIEKPSQGTSDIVVVRADGSDARSSKKHAAKRTALDRFRPTHTE